VLHAVNPGRKRKARYAEDATGQPSPFNTPGRRGSSGTLSGSFNDELVIVALEDSRDLSDEE